MGSIAPSCATTPKSKETKKSLPKAKVVEATNQTQNTQATPKELTTLDMIRFAMRLAQSESPFTVQDRQTLMMIPPNPKPATVHEAALCIGLLRDVMTPPGSPQKMNQLDTASQQTPSVEGNEVLPKPTRTMDESSIIEKRAREKGVDLPLSLGRNEFLKSAAVYSWAWNASLFEGNTELFKQSMANVVKAEATFWVEIAKKSGALVESTRPVIEGTPTNSLTIVPPPVDPNTPSTELPASDTTSSPGSMTLEESNKLLASAQEAASAENYTLAVSLLSKIPSSAENYEIIKDNQRQWSNRAVTDLRRKAAFDYRSATSVSDSNAKRNFLNKAKTYLEEALAKYPAASNLDTVKENLAIIQTEMDKIRQQ
jgi:hypothetical protein